MHSFLKNTLVVCLLFTLAHPSVQRTLYSENAINKWDRNFVETPRACQVYCYGPLLHTVQMAHLFDDSKTFVDMKLKFTPEQVMTDFYDFMAAKNNQPTEEELRQFVHEHFDDLGKEFKPWIPSDWTDRPGFLDLIHDPDLKQWGSDLNSIWKELGRKMIDDVHKSPEYYSIIPVENPVIVPGGRFIEFYYWDSYWIIRGLLYSEMYDTARGMLDNFISIVKRYGFIPNGGRIYYSNRSQPPLLAGMIKSYVDFTKDDKFALDSLDILEHEFEYWMNNHTVQAKGYNVSHYGDSSAGPRPESYREDVESAEKFATEEEKENYYSELKAAAESGMDFSSRWFVNKDGAVEGTLTDLKTRSIIPVELNAILYWNAKIIAQFNSKAGNVEKVTEYETKAQKILEAITAVHWNEEAGVWLDYDLINERPRNYFVPTNLAPLWVQAYNIADSEKISKSVLAYIDRIGLDNYPGGVPNTLYRTGEQWDFPNVWPPMQYMIVEGLDTLGTTEAKNLSTKWGHRWVKSNFQAYSETRVMFEKYNAEVFGGHGGGGEYDVQKGFGWTNGVIIEFLAKYGRQISLNAGGNSAVSNTGFFSAFGLTIAALATTFFRRFIR